MNVLLRKINIKKKQQTTLIENTGSERQHHKDNKRIERLAHAPLNRVDLALHSIYEQNGRGCVKIGF